MRRIQEFSKLGPLLDQAAFTTKEAKRVGVHTSNLSYYAKIGLLERMGRGLYRSADSGELDLRWGDLILSQKSLEGSVVCLITALSLYDLTDEISRKHWLAISNKRFQSERHNSKIVRMTNMKLGLTSMVLGEESIPIFDRERSIVDAFRFLDIEVALKSLRLGLDNKPSINIPKLESYARALRVNLSQYIQAMTI